jgi:hypothetical protein
MRSQVFVEKKLKTNQLAKAGNTNVGERFSTVDLLIKVACFVKNVNNTFNIKVADLN